MYKKNSLNLYFRQKRSNERPPTAHLDKETNVTMTEWRNLAGTRSYRAIKIKLHYHDKNPISEHPSVLISKETNRNKACQTHTAYDARWPELYMHGTYTEYFITPRNQCNKPSNTTTLILTFPNEKETQTNTTYTQTTHRQNGSMLKLKLNLFNTIISLLPHSSSE